MTDINPNYKILTKILNKTRKSLTQTCYELDIDIDTIEDHLLLGIIDQCSHCNIWSQQLIEDLDKNPICPTCVKLVGL